jgi:hypothetical protein
MSPAWKVFRACGHIYKCTCSVKAGCSSAKAELYWPMLQTTAETVAKRYGISRAAP